MSTHERIVSAASELTAEAGWSAITMAKLAERVGVSRQTVYNEIGTKNALAEAIILAELGALLLAVVNTAFDAHPGDLVGAIEGACGAAYSRWHRTTSSCAPSSPRPMAPTPSCCRC